MDRVGAVGAVGLLIALAVATAAGEPTARVALRADPANGAAAGLDFAGLVARPCEGLTPDQAHGLGYSQLGVKSNDASANSPAYLSCQWFGSSLLLDIAARREVFDLIQARDKLGGEIIQLSGHDAHRSALANNHACGLMVTLAPEQTLAVILAAGSEPGDVRVLCDRATAATQTVLGNLRA